MGCVSPSDFWWDVKLLSDGTAAVVVQANGPYAAKYTIKGRTVGLSNAEIRSLKTATQLGNKLRENDEAVEVPNTSPAETKKRPWHFP
jgi:hypothetical protein